MKEDDKRLVFIPIEEATTPPDGFCRIYKDFYWCVHPDRGLIFFGLFGRRKHLSAQCNTNKSLTKGLRDRLYPWAKVKKIAVVFEKGYTHDF